MRPAILRACGLGLLVLLSACVSVDVGHEGAVQSQLLLRDAAERPVIRRAAPLVDALLLQARAGAALADTQSIAYTRREDAFEFYQLAQWTERPVRLVPRLLQERVEARGLAAAVGQVGDPMRADWLLTIGIDALHHDVRSATGAVQVALTADLFDRRSRLRVAHRQFSVTLQTATQDSAAAARSMSLALARTFDELLPWLEDALQSAATAPR